MNMRQLFKIAFEYCPCFIDICSPFSEGLNFNQADMARVCQITGKRPQVGNNVSHANNKTKRRFLPNLQKKRFFIPEEGKWVTLKVSTKALKTISKYGITSVMKEAKAKGHLVL